VAKSQKRADTFIRGHFKWCLAVHFLGGDVSLEFPDRGQELMDDAYDNGVDETEEKWQTTLGKEILDFWGIL
jgi:hypothetical protein